MHNKGLMSYSVEVMIADLVLHVSKHCRLKLGGFDDSTLIDNWAAMLIGHNLQLSSATEATQMVETKTGARQIGKDFSARLKMLGASNWLQATQWKSLGARRRVKAATCKQLSASSWKDRAWSIGQSIGFSGRFVSTYIVPEWWVSHYYQ